MSPKIVMAGGGTAGHVNPLLATAHELRTRGCDISVLGTAQGLEATLVPEAGFEFVVIPRVPFPRRPSPSMLSFPANFNQAIRLAQVEIRDADAVVGFGGYVATPAYIAANRLEIPVIVHEQNARPGLANKLGARKAAVVALSFASTPLKAHRGRTEVTGLPLRHVIAELAVMRETDEGRQKARYDAACALGMDPDVPTLLITGGSLGAQHINEAMSAVASQLPEGVQVVHLTGKEKDGPVRSAVATAGVGNRWKVIDYLTTMEHALALADLVVCRSGAGTVSELMALRLPAVYVPLPFGNGEQQLNAADHVEAGGAILIPDADFTASTVVDQVFPLFEGQKLQEMVEATRSAGGSSATRELADLVMEQVQA